MRGFALVISAVMASSVSAEVKLPRSKMVDIGELTLPLGSGCWRTTTRASSSMRVAMLGALPYTKNLRRYPPRPTMV